MRMMVDLGHNEQIRIMETPTSIECGREVRLRKLLRFRSLVECMVPCFCGLQTSISDGHDHDHHSVHATDSADRIHDHHRHNHEDDIKYYYTSSKTNGSNNNNNIASSSATVTGTFFGYRKGRVSFCLQDHSRSCPLLLLEFAVPTAYLAREMEHGVLRIALVECQPPQPQKSSSSSSFFSVPVWSMYCNGRNVGFAVRRQMTLTDVAVLKLMQSVSVGAGVLPNTSNNNNNNENGNGHGDMMMMYLRATFERVIGSVHSQSFHMINPLGSSAQQQLSIFLLRS